MLRRMSAPPTAPESAEFAAAAAAGELFIVLNPGSGREQAQQKREAIEAVLREGGRPFRFVPCEQGRILDACEAAAQAAARYGGVVVAVGGDGTVNCAAQAALRHGCAIGVVPQGTFNLFARDHGVPQDAEQAVRALLRARPQPVQVGLANQRVFLVNASVGLYPKLLEDRENAKGRLGLRRRWLALLVGLVSLFEWRWQLTLDAELDGQVQRIRTPSLFVCNNRVQLRRVGIEESLAEQVGHGCMAALVAHPLGAWGKLKLLVRAIVGSLGDASELDCVSLRSLDVSTRSARKLKVATDGEVQWMELPLRFAVAPQSLQLLVPAPEDRVPAE